MTTDYGTHDSCEQYADICAKIVALYEDSVQCTPRDLEALASDRDMENWSQELRKWLDH